MTLFFDNFTRPNGPLGTSDSGHPWIVVSGTYSINNNFAVGNVAASMAVLDAGPAGAGLIIGDNWASPAVTPSLVFRCLDANNYFRLEASPATSGGLVYLRRVVSGAQTTVVIVEGEPGPIRIYLTPAGRIRVYRNQSATTVAGLLAATPVIDITDTTHLAATRHGLGASSSIGSSSTKGPFFIDTLNVAPNAPTVTGPMGAVNIDNTTRVSWLFSDNDSGDSQSAASGRMRLVGAPAWDPDLNFTVFSPNQFYDMPPGTLADGGEGDYEFQIQTRDALGLTSPWSASGFFTAAYAPDGPTITAPINGTTIGLAEVNLTWSTPDQDAYEARSVADNMGVPVTGTVLWTSGIVEQPDTRSHLVPLPVNGRSEHLQLRVRHDGLWSQWASVRITAAYTPPAVPTVTLETFDDLARIDVTVTVAPPTGDEPPLALVEVFRRGGGSEGRIAVMPAAGTHPDRKVASGVEYEYRAAATGTNGTTSWSDWIALAETDDPGFGLSPFGTSPFGGSS